MFKFVGQAVEGIKANPKGFVKKVLIGGAIVVGLGLVASAVSKKKDPDLIEGPCEEPVDESIEVDYTEENEVESTEENVE